VLTQAPLWRGRLLPDDAAIIAAPKTKPPRPVSRARRRRLQVTAAYFLESLLVDELWFCVLDPLPYCCEFWFCEPDCCVFCDWFAEPCCWLDWLDELPPAADDDFWSLDWEPVTLEPLLPLEAPAPLVCDWL